MSEQLKIIRRTKQNEGRVENNITLQSKMETMLVLLGKPQRDVKEGERIWYWEDRETGIYWRGFGLFQVEGNENGIRWLLEMLVDKAKAWNDLVKYGVLGCKNELEWEIIREMVGDRLPVYVSAIEFVDCPSRGNRVVHRYKF